MVALNEKLSIAQGFAWATPSSFGDLDHRVGQVCSVCFVFRVMFSVYSVFSVFCFRFLVCSVCSVSNPETSDKSRVGWILGMGALNAGYILKFLMIINQRWAVLIANFEQFRTSKLFTLNSSVG